MLRVTLYGHACVLFDSGNTKVLCDPHLFERFASDLYDIYPHRRIDLASVEKPDFIYLSHHHRDHFDLRSLATIDRSTPVLFPDSEEIEYGLSKLGFKERIKFQDWEHRSVGDLSLVFTPSRERVPENGVLVITRDEIVWNMVDTVTDLEIVRRVDRLVEGRGIDLLLWPYQPLLETRVSENLSMGFPARRFELALGTLQTIAPRHVVPYADAQFAAGRGAWLNRYRFPVEFSEIHALVDQCAPGSKVVTAGPSDRLRVDGREVTREAPASYIEPLPESAQQRSLDTTVGVPPIGEHVPAPLDAALASMDETIATLSQAWTVLRREMRPVMTIASDWDVSYDLVLESDAAATLVRFSPQGDGIETFDASDAASLPDADGNRVVMRTRLGLMQRMIFGQLHYISVVLAGLVRVWQRVVRVRDGVLQQLDFLDEQGNSSMSDHGQILDGKTFLNLLIAAASSEQKHRYIDSELEQVIGSGAQQEVASEAL
ncbi:MAG: MBL fold metallo-hydrolase [Myxococcales bacterium]|nr:MBL fold metallo-hydrolase [Myxococcales bacterium]